MIVDIEDKNGYKTQSIGIPVKLSDTPGGIKSAPVEFGSSTEDVLLEFGYTSEEITDFRKNNII